MCARRLDYYSLHNLQLFSRIFFGATLFVHEYTSYSPGLPRTRVIKMIKMPPRFVKEKKKRALALWRSIASGLFVWLLWKSI